MHRILISSLLLSIGSTLALADTINITPTWTGYNGTGGGNSGRVGFQPVLDQYMVTTDAGGTVQQYPIFNIGTSWLSSVTGPITSATVTFPEAYAGGANSGQNYKIFEAPGSPGYPDYSRTAIDNYNGASVSGTELTSWYAGHTGFGLVTQSQINAVGPVAFDVTNLLEGWRTGTLTTNPGYMMILDNDTSHNTVVAWGATSGNPTMNATISVTFTPVPEPSTLALLAAVAVGLAVWRMRIVACRKIY